MGDLSYLPGAEKAPTDGAMAQLDALIRKATELGWTVNRRSLTYVVCTRPGLAVNGQISFALIGSHLRASRVVTTDNPDDVVGWMEGNV